MRNFVKVCGVGGIKRWVNLDTVREILPGDETDDTEIIYANGGMLHVQETPEQILSGVTIQVPRDSGVDIDEILIPKKGKINGTRY